MYMKDVFEYCNKRGYKVSKAYIYMAGEKYGFIRKIKGKHHLEFDKKKFLKWLDKALEEIPAGWVTLKQLAEMKGISVSMAYQLSKDEGAQVKSIGSGKGVIYVDPERIDEIIEKYKKRHTYNWDEE